MRPSEVTRNLDSALAESGVDKGSGIKSELRNWGTYGGLGFEFAVFIILGVKGGQWLDAKFGTSYLALVGLLFGLAAGFRSLFHLARRGQSRSER